MRICDSPVAGHRGVARLARFPEPSTRSLVTGYKANCVFLSSFQESFSWCGVTEVVQILPYVLYLISVNVDIFWGGWAAFQQKATTVEQNNY